MFFIGQEQTEILTPCALSLLPIEYIDDAGYSGRLGLVTKYIETLEQCLLA